MDYFVLFQWRKKRNRNRKTKMNITTLITGYETVGDHTEFIIQVREMEIIIEYESDCLDIMWWSGVVD